MSVPRGLCVSGNCPYSAWLCLWQQRGQRFEKQKEQHTASQSKTKPNKEKHSQLYGEKNDSRLKLHIRKYFLQLVKGKLKESRVHRKWEHRAKVTANGKPQVAVRHVDEGRRIWAAPRVPRLAFQNTESFYQSLCPRWALDISVQYSHGDP